MATGKNLDKNDEACQRGPEDAEDVREVPDCMNVGPALLDQKNPLSLSLARERVTATLNALMRSSATTYTNKTKHDSAILSGLALIPFT